MDPRLSIVINSLRIHAVAAEPLELEQYSGSAVRGALFSALWSRFCVNKDAATCADCSLVHACPVSALVAPLRDEHPRGRDIPRPFVLAPPAETITCEESRLRLEPEDPFAFGLTIFGTAAKLLPYVVMAAQTMEAHGIGRPLQVNGGRRGRFRVERIEAVNPFSGEVQALYTRGEARVSVPSLAITVAQVAERTATLPTDRLTIQFLTPTRLISDGQLLRTPHFRTLALRLAERFEAIVREYGTPPTDGLAEELGYDWHERYKRIAALAANVRLVTNETSWVDVASYSTRQKRATPIGGLIGRATYEGDLVSELRELLVWGEVLHVGKNVVKGDGHYRIET